MSRLDSGPRGLAQSATVDLFSLYGDAQGLRDVVQQTLDRLIPSERSQVVASFLGMFGDSKRFPSLQNVSEVIENHALTILSQSAAELGVQVLFSGYDRCSSVGRGLALPGSDIDHWIVVVRGSDNDAAILKQTILSKINRLIIDPFLSSHLPPLVTTLDSISSVADIQGGRDSFYLYNLPFREWESSITSWNGLPPLESKPFVGSSEDERESLRAGLIDDSIREQWLLASVAMEVLREGKLLLAQPDIYTFTSSTLYKTSDCLKQIRNEATLQSKHRARACFEQFDELSLDEKFLLVRVFLERHIWHQKVHWYLLSLDRGPHQATARLLVDKGFLCVDHNDPLKVARAAWLDHYPGEKPLPMDY